MALCVTNYYLDRGFLVAGVRRTDSEFGGRGGWAPPKEFQQELDSAQTAALQRMTDPNSTETEDDVRARLEKRALKNDTVGRRTL